MNMFIPPEGAMQFEYKSRIDGTPEGPYVFWVDGNNKDVRPPKCQCKYGWKVILETIPTEPWRNKCFQEMREKNGRMMIACSCMGRIIE